MPTINYNKNFREAQNYESKNLVSLSFWKKFIKGLLTDGDLRRELKIIQKIIA